MLYVFVFTVLARNCEFKLTFNVIKALDQNMIAKNITKYSIISEHEATLTDYDFDIVKKQPLSYELWNENNESNQLVTKEINSRKHLRCRTPQRAELILYDDKDNEYKCGETDYRGGTEKTDRQEQRFLLFEKCDALDRNTDTSNIANL